MDKNTISQYGWIVVLTLVIAVMLAFAQPFGKYVGTGIGSIADALIDSSDSAMNQRDELEDEWEDMFDKMSANNNKTEDDVVSQIVPEGAIYSANNSLIGSGNQIEIVQQNILRGGSTMPTAPQRGDVFIYNKYIYIYQGTFHKDCPYTITIDGETYRSLYADTTGYNTGWLVHYIGDSAVAPQPLRKIAGADVTSFRGAYYNCTSLSQIEGELTLNSNVKDIEQIFSYATNFSGIVTLNIDNSVSFSNTPAPFMGTSKPIILKGTYSKKTDLAIYTNITVQ